MMQRLKRSAAAAILVLSLMGSAHAATSMTPDQLKAMVADLGYQPTMDGSYYVHVENQGKQKVTVNFFLTDDNTVLAVSISFDTIAADKRSKLPVEAILKANDTNRFYYALGGSKDKGEFLALLAKYDVSSLNKATLRKAIDGILESADTGESLWNPDKWSEAAAADAAPAAK